MKQTVNFSDFCIAFHQCGREDQFTYDAKEMLFDYFEEVDPEYELAVIAICCEFSEDYDEQRAIVREYLEDHTTLIGETKNGSFVYVQF